MPATPTGFLTVVAIPHANGSTLISNHVAMPYIGQVLALLPAKNFLGRSNTSGIVLCLPYIHISRRHALIELFSPGSWEIEDLNSRNGTFLNGQRLSPNALTPLNDGDRIAIGSPQGVELLFTFQPLPKREKGDLDEKISLDEFLEREDPPEPPSGFPS